VASRSGCSKIDLTRVAIIGQLALGIRVARLAMKCVRHRCQEASLSTAEMTCSTPLSPRATRERRKGPFPELGDLGVEVGGHATHLGLGEPVDAHCFDQVIDPASRHAFDVGPTITATRACSARRRGTSSQSGR